MRASDSPEGGRGDRSFGPVVLLGLAGAGLAAVAATRSWASAEGDAAGLRVDASVTGSQAAPLAAALALVALAAWGVVLVARGRARRAVAAVGALAAGGALAACVLGFSRATDDARDAVVAQGASADTVAGSLTAWLILAALGALVTAGAFVVAVRRAPGWPAMGSRYDAPAARRDTPVAEEDMWRSLDEGHDPTS